MLYTWYPWLIKTDQWWVQQCPTFVWTSTTISDSNDVASSGTAKKYEVNKDTNWTKDRCLAAAPVKQWTDSAYVWIFIYGFSLLTWSLNTLFDNRGGWIHMLFWRNTQVWTVMPIITAIMTIVATSSYGSQKQVFVSWSGSETFADVTSSKADNKYLMWTDVNPVFSATTFTLKDLVSYRAFDTNRTSAVTVSWITSVINLIIAVFDLWFFYYSYEIAYNIRHDKWEHVYNDDGFDENGYDAEGFNAAGCNEEGNDKYGDACAADFSETDYGVNY
jgi:hypothetical protein